ncbi:hypothetical protein VNO77_27037 [Canavalia gladiata]|uniref:Uncharacterized protein n=1 Tax=Canavalia gladiata TaxID=3824 RepID=A0AAN9KTE7_CANGL
MRWLKQRLNHGVLGSPRLSSRITCLNSLNLIPSIQNSYKGTMRNTENKHECSEPLITMVYPNACKSYLEGKEQKLQSQLPIHFLKEIPPLLSLPASSILVRTHPKIAKTSFLPPLGPRRAILEEKPRAFVPLGRKKEV